jgi:hypothetical protein
MDEDVEPSPAQPVLSLSSSVEQLSLSSSQQREVQELRRELRDCGLYSGVGVIYRLNVWKPVEPLLLSLNYKIIRNFPARTKVATSFATIAQSIAPPKQHAIPTVAESSDSPPFVIAVFVSERTLFSQLLNLYIGEEKVNIIDDIIQPFLPQSAPHLQHIPKLFFITAYTMHPGAPPPQFPEDPDGNYCVVYHVTNTARLGREWVECIIKELSLPGMTVQDAIEKSRSHLRENIHYFTCLKNNLVLKK